MNNIEKKIYEVMDSFLTEAKDQNGKDRSLSQLNTDRHLFVKKMEEILKEQREDIVKEIERMKINGKSLQKRWVEIINREGSSTELYDKAITDITKLIKQ